MKYFYSYNLMSKTVQYTCSKLKIPFLNYFDFVLYRKKNTQEMHAFQMEPLFKAKYEQLLDNLTERAKTGKPIDFKEYVLRTHVIAIITQSFF